MSGLSADQLSLVDAPPEEGFDRFTRLATQILGVPVALVSIVEPEKNRQFFTSACGLPEPWASRRQTPLSHSFCQHVKKSGECLLVEDARKTPLVADNLAIPDLDVIAYLGLPIHCPHGTVLGALCAIDTSPRAWSEQDVLIMTDLAASVTDQIGLRAAVLDAEKAARTSAQLGAVVENAHHEVYTFQSDTLLFTGVNRGARENLGYSLDELRALTPVDIKPDFSQEAFDDFVRPLRRGDIPYREFETVHARKDGSFYPVAIRLELHARDATYGEFIAFCEDITERRALEQSLQDKTEDFAALVQNSPDPILIADIDTKLTMVNAAYGAFLERDPASLLGEKFLDLVPANYRRRVEAGIAKATPKSPFSNILLKQTVNGKLRSLIWTNVVQFKAGKPTQILAIGKDVTLLQEARQRAEQNERASQRAFEVRKTFLANMSHEVRTPLNAIMGLFQLIQSADVPARQKKQAEVGLAASHHLLSQLVNVLELSRVEANAVKITPLPTQLRDLAHQWLETAVATCHRLGKPVEVSLLIDDEMPETWHLDARRVTQIVNNLTDNALKFTEQGKVHIEVRGVTEQGKAAERFLDITVSDTGCGITQSQRDVIFDRFFQADSAETRKNGGSGLGLAISRELATLMGAALIIAPSNKDNCFKTEFKLRLPVPPFKEQTHAIREEDLIS